MRQDQRFQRERSAVKIDNHKFTCKKADLDLLDMCYRILSTEGKLQQIYVPTCVQFKFKSFTSVDFQNLSAMINGVICVNFLIFTHDQNLLSLLLDRLYWNPKELEILEINRKKKVERQSYNFVPIFFNKDGNIKIPTTRQKQFQTQAFISPVTIQKAGNRVTGLKITHVIRKQFVVEIIKNTMKEQFWAPFNFINLNLTLTLDYMAVQKFQELGEEQEIEERRDSKDYVKQNQYYSSISNAINNYQSQKKDKKEQKKEFQIKKIGFNLLRIQDHYNNKDMDSEEKMKFLSPMISCVLAENFGKYNIVSSKMQAFTSDRRDENVQIEDSEPTQHTFKPFRYAIFKIPLYRYPIVDTLTIFVPLWLLAFISIYIFYQTTEIMNRIINVAALMIAYAAIQPIVRENIPQATTLTFVDCLFYLELLINILFLARSIDIRSLYDEKVDQVTNVPYTNSNFTYDRWTDPLFLISLGLTILNLVSIFILIVIYLFQQKDYRVERVPKTTFNINRQQNWTLRLLMDRAFARYKESIVIFDDILARGKSVALQPQKIDPKKDK